jgi:hypothetical protein
MALNNGIMFVTSHNEMVFVIGINERSVVILASPTPGSNEIVSPIHTAIDRLPKPFSAASNASLIHSRRIVSAAR